MDNLINQFNTAYKEDNLKLIKNLIKKYKFKY